MRDLISRQAAIDALGERPIVWTDDDQYTLGERNQYDIDRLTIETLSAVQPEIIMCKDCIHSPAAHDDCPLPVQYIVPDGFCHLGRGKDE